MADAEDAHESALSIGHSIRTISRYRLAVAANADGPDPSPAERRDADAVAAARGSPHTGSPLVSFTRCSAKLDLTAATPDCSSSLPMMKRDPQLCTGCEICAKACARGAIAKPTRRVIALEPA